MNRVINPLRYPVTIVIASIVLLLGLWLVQLSIAVMLPTAIGLAFVGAAICQARFPQLTPKTSALSAEQQIVHRQVQVIAQQAEALQQEAIRSLTDPHQQPLLTVIQQTCERADHLVATLDALMHRLRDQQSYFTVEQLTQQLAAMEHQLVVTSATEDEPLVSIADSLQHCIQRAQRGQDTRQTQLSILSMLILSAIDVLQEMYRTVQWINLPEEQQASNLHRLSTEFKGWRDYIQFLVS